MLSSRIVLCFLCEQNDTNKPFNKSFVLSSVSNIVGDPDSLPQEPGLLVFGSCTYELLIDTLCNVKTRLAAQSKKGVSPVDLCTLTLHMPVKKL